MGIIMRFCSTLLKVPRPGHCKFFHKGDNKGTGSRIRITHKLGLGILGSSPLYYLACCSDWTGSSQKKKRAPVKESSQEKVLSPLPLSMQKEMWGRSYDEHCPIDTKNLCYLKVLYRNEKGKVCSGGLIVNRKIAKKAEQIFRDIFTENIVIHSIKPVHQSGSMERALQNNHSFCFCSPPIIGLSAIKDVPTSYGFAFVINPRVDEEAQKKIEKLPEETTGEVLPLPRQKLTAIFQKQGFSLKLENNNKGSYFYFIFPEKEEGRLEEDRQEKIVTNIKERFLGGCNVP